MKGIIKIIAAAAVVMTLMYASCFEAAAEEVTEVDEAIGTAEENTAENTDVVELPEDEYTQPEEPTFFSELYSAVKENATEILCSLSLIGSVILAYAYKKGLIPLLKGSLDALLRSVGKIKENTELNETESEAFKDFVSETIDAEAQLFNDAVKHLDKLGHTLDSVTEKYKDSSDKLTALQGVMREQTQMLYDIFMASGIPQYQKDKVGERVAKMKEALKEDETVV